MAKVIKEIIIMLLICLLTMFIFAIALYKFIPNKKAIPEIQEYVADSDIKDLLEDDIKNRSSDENIILTYEVTKNDLAGYQKTYTYVPGKANPFAPVSEDPETNATTNTTNTTGGSSTSSNTSTTTNSSTSTNSLLDDDGTK